MGNRILVVLSVVFLGGLVSLAIAQNSPTTSRVKTSTGKDSPPGPTRAAGMAS